MILGTHGHGLNRGHPYPRCGQPNHRTPWPTSSVFILSRIREAFDRGMGTATMKLLGDWNWYLPRSLRRIPRIAHEPALETR